MVIIASGDESNILSISMIVCSSMKHALVLGAPSSGSGKTVIGLCIAGVMLKRGYKVQPFKIGPDFIDPTHFEHSIGIPAVNLDVYMMGEEGVKKSYFRWSKGKDFCLIEGVMGFFDGVSGTVSGSSAHISKILNIPSVLIIDTGGMSSSAVAMAKGFMEFDKDIRFAGVILNRVGGEKHRDMLVKAFKRAGIPVLGIFPRTLYLEVGSRHLGLKMGFEETLDVKKLAKMGEEYLDVEKILELSAVENYCSGDFDSEFQREEKDLRVAVAFDEAFCFYYKDNLEELRRFYQKRGIYLTH